MTCAPTHEVCKQCGKVTRDEHTNQRGCEIKNWYSCENVYEPCVFAAKWMKSNICRRITISQGSRGLFFTHTQTQGRDMEDVITDTMKSM